MKLPSYPKIQTLGHRTIKNIFDDPVEITEKVDGSQFKFGKVNGELFCCSKDADLVMEMPQHLFVSAVAKVKSIEHLLPEDLTFYSETLFRPKHNVLSYDRVPNGNIALFGVMHTESKIMHSYAVIQAWADILKMDVVPLIYQGPFKVEDIPGLLDRVSYLGGVNIEGVVVKNYHKDAMIGDLYIPYLVGKYVSEKFKEQHGKNAYGRKADKNDVGAYLESFCTEARFNKAVLHLKEKGELLGEPKDIGPLLKELNEDYEAECKDQVKEWLWLHFRREALRRMSYGFPQWYKEQLLKGVVE